MPNTYYHNVEMPIPPELLEKIWDLTTRRVRPEIKECLKEYGTKYDQYDPYSRSEVFLLESKTEVKIYVATTPQGALAEAKIYKMVETSSPPPNILNTYSAAVKTLFRQLNDCTKPLQMVIPPELQEKITGSRGGERDESMVYLTDDAIRCLETRLGAKHGIYPEIFIEYFTLASGKVVNISFVNPELNAEERGDWESTISIQNPVKGDADILANVFNALRVCAGEQVVPNKEELMKKVRRREMRAITRGLIGKKDLPDDLRRKIALDASSGTIGGKKKTRKGLKKTRKGKKSRKTRGGRK